MTKLSTENCSTGNQVAACEPLAYALQFGFEIEQGGDGDGQHHGELGNPNQTITPSP